MSNDRISPHWSFWLIGVILFLWNFLGSVNFMMQMNPEMIDNYRETEQLIIQGRPLWATAAFAIGVFAGAIGCALLLLRKRAAWYFFLVSLLGVVITTIHTATSGIKFSGGEFAVIVLGPTIVALFMLWYFRFSQKRNWI